MNKVTILLLGNKSGQNETNVSFCPLLLLKDRENLLKQGFEFGTVLAI